MRKHNDTWTVVIAETLQDMALAAGLLATLQVMGQAVGAW